MDALMIGLIVGGFIALVLIIWIFSTWNRLVRLEENANKSWADIDVLLKQRYDMIPNLVNSSRDMRSTREKSLSNLLLHDKQQLVLLLKAMSRALELLKAFSPECFHASTWSLNNTLISRQTHRSSISKTNWLLLRTNSLTDVNSTMHLQPTSTQPSK